MSPKDDDLSHGVPSPTGSDVIGGEESAPVTDTPSPPATPSPPPPPPVVQLPAEEALHRDLHPFVPYAPYTGDPNDCLPLNCNLQQVLRRVTGQEELHEVFDLKLRVIASEMSLQRVCYNVPNLRELNLDGSCLVSLRDLGCSLVHLEVLRISRCGLDSLDGLFGLTSLLELHAGDNRIDDISPCTALPLIRLIDLRANRIADIAYISFLSICTHLQHLILSECPAAKAKGYREEVRRSLPKLITLDGEQLNNRAEEDTDLETEDSENEDDDDEDFDGGGLDDWLNSSPPPPASDRSRQEGQAGGMLPPPPPGTPSIGRKLTRSARAATDGARCSSSCDTKSSSRHDNQKRVDRCASAACGTVRSSSSTDALSLRGDDVPSRLTSGPLLSGNLATSRRRRKRRPLTSVEARIREMNLHDGNDGEDLMAETKKWQEEYHAFRDIARTKRWLQERQKDDGDLSDTASPSPSLGSGQVPEIAAAKTLGSSPDYAVSAQGAGDGQVEEAGQN